MTVRWFSVLSEKLGNILIESFSRRGAKLSRHISLSDKEAWTSEVSVPSPQSHDVLKALPRAFDQAWLRSTRVPKIKGSERRSIRVADLFSGCGGMSVGIAEAARATGHRAEFAFALDSNTAALHTYGSNFPDAILESSPIEEIFQGEFGEGFTKSEKELKAKIGKLDLIVGGPPCQGHSALNNHTRHDDYRNQLYFKMARVAEIFQPDHLIIENVPGVLKDRTMVAQRTWQALEEMGYTVNSATLNAKDFGVSQSRKRNFTVASVKKPIDFEFLTRSFSTEVRDVKWAIGDLLTTYTTNSIFDSSTEPSEETIRRINFLFENNLFDLPDSERPDCHKLKAHTYKSVYGRLNWDKPAQTITTGFGGMGRGRYVHPSQKRTLTPHEAARLQFFPDFFHFPNVSRTLLQNLIGNAVPPKLAYVIGIELLR